MSSDKRPVRNLFDSLDDDDVVDTKTTATTGLEAVNIEIDLSDEPRKKSTSGKKMKRVTIVEPDFEDDDEESDPRKMLLFKDVARLKLKDLTPGSSKHDRQKLLGEVIIRGGEEDEVDDDGDSYEAIPGHDRPNTKGKNKKSPGTASSPSITINKIKIFKPRRTLRQRLRRLRVVLFWFFALAFLVFLFYNIELLPAFIRNQFGIDLSGGDSAGGAGHRRGQAHGQCNQVMATPVWQQNFPMLTIESALRMVDVNNDTHLDVIVPFGTGVDAAYYDPTLCEIYFNQTKRESDGKFQFRGIKQLIILTQSLPTAIGCGGGFMALDGTSGEPLWAQYTAHELFASSCTLDLNGDGGVDCVFAGRMASLMAVDGRTGAVIWSMSNQLAGSGGGGGGGQVLAETSNFYTPLPIPKDVDGDGVPELVVMHGGDPLRKRNEAVRNVARLLVVSGRTGRVITWGFVPDGAESYYSPQLLVQPDGTTLVLYGTGGETHAGGLYVVALDTLLADRVEHGSRLIFRDCCKGVITPPVLIDITGDEILDIIIANFNTTVMAIDGLTFEPIWTRRFESGETYSTPTVGFFNDDDVPDFGVNYQFGPGFPIYRSAQFDILDGRNGRSLLRRPIEMKIGTQSSPLTISTFALNDIFLYWYSSCSNETTTTTTSTSSSNTTTTDRLADAMGDGATTSVFQSSRMNFCKLRFGSNGQYYSQLQALTPNADPVVIYDSRRDEPKVLEQFNYTAIAYTWLANNYGEVDTGGGLQQQQQPQGDSNLLWSSLADQAFKKYKKNVPGEVNSGSIDNIIQQLLQQQQQGGPEEMTAVGSRRYKRHVGLHNGDQIQRVIATGRFDGFGCFFTETNQTILL